MDMALRVTLSVSHFEIVRWSWVVSGVASISSLLIHIIKFLYSNYPASTTIHEEQSMWLRILELSKRFDQKDPSVHHFRRSESRVHPVTGPESIGASPEIDYVNEMTSNEEDEDGGEIRNHDNLTSGNSGTYNIFCLHCRYYCP
ncbi:hypothetical protein SADUNF_Sadunf06G0137700 [Salix dunnii]|uniref:Uncharacterized protein n=1 Tax=Salix dunnii TaxID=1413687 RepID=A0A835K773_9ROSI|nr:hypothetical protein SADUNF_Sadunf06G0137700 [Salix dunnii]